MLPGLKKSVKEVNTDDFDLLRTGSYSWVCLMGTSPSSGTSGLTMLPATISLWTGMR